MLQYFLPGILALGIITSYEDIKTGKIRNKWIIAALVYAFLVYAVLLANYFFTTGLNYHYLIELVTNFIFAVAIGYCFWHFGIWTAGDGKLFIAFASIIPFSVYSIGYLEWTPSITLLVNIFIPALIWIMGYMFFKVKIKYIVENILPLLKELVNIKKLFIITGYIFAIQWVIQIILSLIGLGNNYVLMIVATILAFSVLEEKFKDKSMSIILIISAARLILDANIRNVSFAVNLIIMVFGWKLFRSVVGGVLFRLGQEVFSKKIMVSGLKEGMILQDGIQKSRNKPKEKGTVVKKDGVFYIKKVKGPKETYDFIDEQPEGLTKAQVRKIKNIGFKTIQISQTIPFAPLTFLGVILTLLVKGNILIVVINLLFGG